MKDIDVLKKLNFREKLGFKIKKNPKKATVGVIISLILLLILIFSPQLIFLAKKNMAEGYIKKSENEVFEIRQEFLIGQSFLEKEKKLYKELDLYNNFLENSSSELNDFDNIIASSYKDLEMNKIEKILKEYSHYKDKGNKREIFSDKLNNFKNKYKETLNEIKEISELDKNFLDSNIIFNDTFNKKEVKTKDIKDKYDIIQLKGKTYDVKTKSKQYLNEFINKYDTFSNTYSNLQLYDESSQGKFTITELREIKNKYNNLLSEIYFVNSSYSDFDIYWNKLIKQYYTIVSKQYSERSIKYETETNPDFKEWQEQEEYQEIVTKYKKEYKGSKIVDGKQEDIYEDIPYQETVTKTRTVTKDNGKPRTIQVEYDFYTFYYRIEKTTSTGTTYENIKVGTKHEKYDLSYKTWSYDSSQQVGYTVWKQLFNDVEVKGINLFPKIERW